MIRPVGLGPERLGNSNEIVFKKRLGKNACWTLLAGKSLWLEKYELLGWISGA